MVNVEFLTQFLISDIPCMLDFVVITILTISFLLYPLDPNPNV